MTTAAVHTPLEIFRTGLDFALDPFQTEACQALQEDRSVLVAAPTGAGKTVVAEFAVFLARSRGVKAFYTTPIKALSNQKFAELSAAYGDSEVGLLTGDTVINGDAPIVVMTTEVLRNMVYANSTSLDTLGVVVLDEVHYLADKFRGAVWEEIIIHLPQRIQMVSLSATVSNAEEFGAWLAEVRGQTDVIVSEHRPVPLFNHVLVGSEMFDVFASDDSHDLNSALTRYIAQVDRGQPSFGGGRRRRGNRRMEGRRGGGHDRRRSGPARMRRPQLISKLDAGGMLPAIVFIFSRAGCDAAVEQCLARRTVLTTPDDRKEIQAALDEVAQLLDPADLPILGYETMRQGMLNGYAAHHAGMLPVFKEIVEVLFQRGLLRVVFATETLALGINMPARSVVLEKLVKFNGESHTQITPGEYTQLTGRAGRRGIDTEGHAVVLWESGVDPEEIAGLASRRSYKLNSSFRPTYNMAANLTSRLSRSDAAKVLETSFAQFQADKGVVGVAKRVRRNEEALAGYAESMQCDRGDFAEYAALRRELAAAEKKARKATARLSERAIVDSLLALRIGDVVTLSGGKYRGNAVVLAPASMGRAHLQMPTVLGENARIWPLRQQEVTSPLSPRGRVKVPKKFDSSQPRSRRDLASSLRNADHDGRLLPGDSTQDEIADESWGSDEVARIKAALAAHPCHTCPDRERHARWANRWWNLHRENEGLIHQIEGRTSSIARIFDRVCAVLTELDFLPNNAQILRRIYGERDLLTALAVREGLFADLDPAEIAALVSMLVYQGRREDPRRLENFPTAALGDRARALVSIWSDLDDREEQHRLTRTPEPEFGLVWPIYLWAQGRHLDSVLGSSELAAGDFVRWVKQVVDSIDQVSQVAPSGLRPALRAAMDAINRGVAAA